LRDGIERSGVREGAFSFAGGGDDGRSMLRDGALSREGFDEGGDDGRSTLRDGKDSLAGGESGRRFCRGSLRWISRFSAGGRDEGSIRLGSDWLPDGASRGVSLRSIVRGPCSAGRRTGGLIRSICL
jgi:hypothetical protein